MGNQWAACAALTIFMLIVFSTQFAAAFEINPQTSTATAVFSSESSGGAFGALQFIPKSISGILGYFHAAEALLAQYTGMLSVLNPTEVYKYLNDGVKSMTGINLSEFLQVIRNGLVWVIHVTIITLSFVSNLIAGSLTHL